MSKLIMLIEDTALHRKLFTIWMEMDGHTVHAISDERLTYTEAARVRPDIVVADIRLPHMDGKDIIRTLKAGRDTHHIPVIAWTVLDSRQDREACYAAGADVFLNKGASRTAISQAVLGRMG